ncbi:2,3-diketo-5-methylthiopentyl-1-phosphate enolase [Alicyclobacillus contaminans]|uniref:2,3-diketo-5-methylthiopentyl-1-phosphate enolase n=1 Tax=Alicyclobacillus contaminans TaxID=392016 RepID=UPI000417E4F0|nr:2,3-diketo-5-methylthiopentyl-1-phosphate enolase [Alicyclobacillus contaminans]GMA50591.1 2,3-diketo-5-methylthiopentyl-1-phosphate enolase [Alicyclobacillus contaminans]
MNEKPGYALARYLLVDKPDQLERRAEGMAVGLTVGSWTDLPATRQASMQPYCGTVEGVEIQEELENGRVRAEVTIGYPTRNFGPSIPALLTTVFGKLSMDGQIRLVDLRLPKSFIAEFPGPKFGVDGVRERARVHGRPLVMSIFKSCIGQDLDELAVHFREQAAGGVDLIKDDEIFFSEQLAAPETRVQRFRQLADDIASTTGKPVLYAVNLTGPTFGLLERAKRLSDLGAGALLLNVVAYGYDVLQALASNPDVHVPILAHPAVAGAMYGSATHGISSHILLGQLLRLAGADIAIYPSPYGSVTLAAKEGAALVESLREPNGLKPVLPAPSAGIHPGLVPTLVRDFGMDIIVNAGGAIHGHPLGATGGGQAFMAAVAAVGAGQSLKQAAEHSEPLRLALDKWGYPSA